MYKKFRFNAYEGKEITIHSWIPKKVKAVIQIVHGMGEHGKRYGTLAKYFNENDIAVFADDHRGHGETAENIDGLGDIGKDGFNKMVEDERAVMNYIKEHYKDIPVFLFGHSMGSFISQEYISRYSNINGLILSGSAGKFGFEVKVGEALAKMISKINGGKKPSKLIDKLCFGDYNKKIEKSKGKYDWLSTDSEVVKKYTDDPYCGTVFPSEFYYYFFKALKELHIKKKIENIDKNIPVLLIAGEDDPVGNYGKSVKKLYKLYKNLNIKDLKLNLYKGGRHEVFNDLNKEEIYNDLKSWIEKRI